LAVNQTLNIHLLLTVAMGIGLPANWTNFLNHPEQQYLALLWHTVAFPIPR